MSIILLPNVDVHLLLLELCDRGGGQCQGGLDSQGSIHTLPAAAFHVHTVTQHVKTIAAAFSVTPEKDRETNYEANFFLESSRL